MLITKEKLVRDTIKEDKILLLLEKYIKSINDDSKYVFLSHKHSEEQYVFHIKSLLEKHGFNGYVDWEDEEMPIETSGETAKKIKNKILKSHKFILIATNAAIESKWCNWELGYADAHKYIDALAILPLEDNNSSFRGKEYLHIYPSIQTTSNELPGLNYYIKYPDGKSIYLSTWLNS